MKSQINFRDPEDEEEIEDNYPTYDIYEGGDAD